MSSTEPQVVIQVNDSVNGTAAKNRESNGVALASLICGILSFFLGIVTAIPAVICGHIALGQLKREPDRFDPNARSMSVAGLIMGYIFIGLTVLLLGVILLLGFAAIGAA